MNKFVRDSDPELFSFVQCIGSIDLGGKSAELDINAQKHRFPLL